MTQDTFNQFVGSLTRHALTLASGVLIAHGLTGSGNELLTAATPIAATVAALLWSWLEKTKAAPSLDAVSDTSIQDLAGIVAQFKANGAQPALVAHMAATLASIAQAEAQVFALQTAPAPDVPPAPPVVGAEPAAAPVAEARAAVVVEPFQPPVADETSGDGA